MTEGLCCGAGGEQTVLLPPLPPQPSVEIFVGLGFLIQRRQ